MSRPAVVGCCAAALLVGVIVGRATGSGSSRTVTVSETVERSVVVGAQHIGAARDPRNTGPLDLSRVSSARRGALLETTIVARAPWRDSLLRRGVRLSLLYDVDLDGSADRRDIVSLFNGKLMSWISSLGQGVQRAEVTRRSPTTITVSRDASLFYNRPGQGGQLLTSAINVAVVAKWNGRVDRVPNRGWITVPPPPAEDAAPSAATTLSAPKTTTAPCVRGSRAKSLAALGRDLAAIRAAAKLPTKDRLRGNAAINRATDRFLHDVALAPIGNKARNRWIDHAMSALAGVCEQCFQALEANRPVVDIKYPDAGCGA